MYVCVGVWVCGWVGASVRACVYICTNLHSNAVGIPCTTNFDRDSCMGDRVRDGKT